MVDIKIQGFGTIADANVSGKLDPGEAIALDAGLDWSKLGISETFLRDMLKDVALVNGESIDEVFNKVIQGDKPTTPEGWEELLGKAEKIESKLKTLEDTVKDLQTKLDAEKSKTPKNQAEIDKLENNLKVAKQMATSLKSELSQANGVLQNADAKAQAIKDQIRSFLQKQGLSLASEQPSGSGSTSSSTTSPLTSAKAQTGGDESGTSATNNQGAAGKALTGGTSPYDGLVGGKAQDGITLGTTADDGLLSLYDIQGEQQKRQHMMTLFFYYARMAMSGDIGAMYQFMRFIGYVIARDKALQNVWMGTKLIELQETSRKATEALLKYKVGEGAAENAEWQKELQKIKSEEGIVATSQKLISQMMEEFTQVVETLTNVQKSLLDVNGKVLSNLSVWR